MKKTYTKTTKHQKTNYEIFRDQQLKDPKRRERYEAELARLRLAEEIITLRKKKKFSQTELAKKARMGQPAIARLESGSENPRYETVVRIFGALGEKQIPA